MTIPVASWTSPCYHDYSHMAIPISMVSHDIMTIYMVPWLCGIFNTIHMVPWLFTWYHDCPHGTMTIYIVSLLSTWYHDYLHSTMTIYMVPWLSTWYHDYLQGTITIYGTGIMTIPMVLYETRHVVKMKMGAQNAKYERKTRNPKCVTYILHLHFAWWKWTLSSVCTAEIFTDISTTSRHDFNFLKCPSSLTLTLYMSSFNRIDLFRYWNDQYLPCLNS